MENFEKWSVPFLKNQEISKNVLSKILKNWKFLKFFVTNIPKNRKLRKMYCQVYQKIEKCFWQNF